MAYVNFNRGPSVFDVLRMSLPTALTLLWLTTGFALYASQTWLIQTFGVYMGVAFLAHIGWGALQTLVFIPLMFFRRDVRILLPMMLVAAPMFFYGIGLFRRVGDQAAFHFIRAPYDRAVAEAYAPRDRPVFLAFPWTDARVIEPASEKNLEPVRAGGRAIVYDENDTIDGVNAFTWRERSPMLAETIKGKPDRCIPFAMPHYYLCSFS